jgi:hypothetical protein
MLWGTVFFGSLVSEQAQTLTSTPPSVVPAADGIFVAFQSHSIVGTADWHGLAQEEDFYVDLIRDPRFTEEIDNVVVEFGGAAQQDPIDQSSWAMGDALLPCCKPDGITDFTRPLY